LIDTIINIRPLCYNNVPADTSIAELAGKIKNKPALFVLLHEKNSVDQFAPQFWQYIEACKSAHARYLLIDEYYKPYHHKFSHYFDQIHYVDWFWIRTWHQAMVEKIYPVVNECHPQINRFLFLGGKPDRLNRTRLLWKLSTTGALSQCRFSYFMSDERYTDSRKQIPEVSDEQFAKFVNDHLRFLDKESYTNISGANAHLEHGQWHDEKIPTGVIYTPTIFSQLKFALVSETFFDTGEGDGPRLSEKTFQHISNCVPVLVAGDIGTSTLLQQMGFDTLDDQMAIENWDDPERDNYLQVNNDYHKLYYCKLLSEFESYYDDIKESFWPPVGQVDKYPEIAKEAIDNFKYITTDSELRLNALVTNVDYLLKHSDPARLKQAAMHNKNVFLEQGQNKHRQLEQLLQTLKIKATVEQVVSMRHIRNWKVY